MWGMLNLMKMRILDVVYYYTDGDDVDGHVHLFFCLIVAISISPNKVDPVKP